jgi:soluble lytic murein transglycosylase-like protein
MQLFFMLLAVNIAIPNTEVPMKNMIKLINPRLTESQVEMITGAVNQYAAAFGIDPKIVYSVMAVESNFNPYARGAIGEIGLMQLRPEYHASHLPDIEERRVFLSDIDNNVQQATKYLASLKGVFEARYPGLQFVEFYNRGPNAKPKRFPYTEKVSAVYKVFGGL